MRKADQNAEVLIGDHPAITLEVARERAAHLIQLVRDGVDIRNASPRTGDQSPPAPLPSPDAGASLGALRRDGKSSANDIQALFARHVVEPWPDLVARPAAHLQPAQVREVLARMAQMGIRRQTNILRAYMQAAYTHGAHADLDPRRPQGEASRFKLTGNPVSFVPRITEFEQSRDRVLSDAELVAVWKGLDALRPEVGLTFRCAILLGGQRFKQLLRTTWTDYDSTRRVLTLLDPKGRRKVPMPHLLPVPSRVASRRHDA